MKHLLSDYGKNRFEEFDKEEIISQENEEIIDQEDEDNIAQEFGDANINVGGNTSTGKIRRPKEHLRHLGRELSPTMAFKRNLIRSRIYIDGDLIQEDITKNICKLSHNLYLAMIIILSDQAENLTNSENVRSRLNIFATEDEEIPFTEWGVDNLLFDDVVYSEENNRGGVDQFAAARDRRDEERLKRDGRREEREDRKEVREIRRVEPNDDYNLPYSKTVELTFRAGASSTAEIKTTLNVIMAPYIIPDDIAYKFILLDARLPFSKRYLMWKAGEIRFFKDLILGVDIYNKHQRILKKDKNRLLEHFSKMKLRKQYKVMKDDYQRYRDDKGTKSSSNIYNSVLVFTENTVKKAFRESGLDLHKPKDRNSYFNATMSMMIFIVDQTYGNRVTLYMNGIEGQFDYTETMMKDVNKKHSEISDLTKLIETVLRANQ